MTTPNAIEHCVQDHTNSLRNDVAAVVPVLSEIVLQLDSGMQQMEQAVAQIDTTLKDVPIVPGEEAQHPLSEISARIDQWLQLARKTFSEHSSNFETSRHQILKAVRGIEQVAIAMLSANRSLRGIDGIAARFKVISINAQIEASRAGVHGLAIGSIAAEAGRIIAEINAICQSFKNSTETNHRELVRLMDELSEIASHDQTLLSSSRVQAEQTFDKVRLYLEELESIPSRSQMSCSNRDIEKLINQTAVELQFHHRVRQILGQGVSALRGVEIVLRKRLQEYSGQQLQPSAFTTQENRSPNKTKSPTAEESPKNTNAKHEKSETTSPVSKNWALTFIQKIFGRL